MIAVYKLTLHRHTAHHDQKFELNLAKAFHEVLSNAETTLSVEIRTRVKFISFLETLERIRNTSFEEKLLRIFFPIIYIQKKT